MARGTNGYDCSRAISRDTSFRWIKHRQRFLSKQIVYRYMTKNPLQKKRYVVIAGCFRNIYDVLKKLLRAPWLPMRNVDTHSSCWRSRRWLWPSRWKTPSSETNCRMCQLSQNNMGMEIKKNGQSTSIANEQPCVVNEKKL